MQQIIVSKVNTFKMTYHQKSHYIIITKALIFVVKMFSKTTQPTKKGHVGVFSGAKNYFHIFFTVKIKESR